MYLEITDPVTIHFRHYEAERLLRDGEVVLERATLCLVHKGLCKKKGCEASDIGVGTATCSYKDMFVKRIGRKIALTSALEGVDKAIRAEIWAKYFEMTPRSKG